MTGAVMYEGWADTPEAATALLEPDEIGFAQWPDFKAVKALPANSASLPWE